MFFPSLLFSIILSFLAFVISFQLLSRTKDLIRSKNFLIGINLCTLITMVGLGYIDSHGINNSSAPHGIVSFEFVWTSEQANMIMRSWSGEDKIMVGLSIGLDYLFMPLYATSIASLLLYLNENNMILASLQYSAAMFDAVETGALAVILTAPQEKYPEFIPKLASTCATMKFSILFLALAYGSWKSVLYIQKRMFKRKV
jgi:hypothetical protein